MNSALPRKSLQLCAKYKINLHKIREVLQKNMESQTGTLKSQITIQETQASSSS